MASPLFKLSTVVACIMGSLLIPPAARGQSRLYSLLRSQRNMTEIELTDAQEKRIEDMRKELNYRKSEMRKAVDVFEKETRERIMSVLTGRQVERLSQLYYQSRGPRALEEPETAKELLLSEDQIKQIQTIRQEAQEKYRKDRRNYRQIMAARDAKYLTVLTRRQRTRWEKMLGPPRKTYLQLTSDQQRALWSYLRKVSPLTSSRYEDELELTDRQKEKIKELSQRLWSNNSDVLSIRERFADRYEKAQGEKQKAKIQQEMADALTELCERRVKEIYSVLTRKQRERLSRLREEIAQRRYRYRGTSALPSADIAEKLGLTEAQLEKMKMLREAAQRAQQKEQQESRARLERIKTQRDQHYLEVLTPEQRAKWSKMLGRPLKRKPDV